MTAEEAAVLILRSFKMRGTQAGHVENYGAIQSDFLKPDGRTGAQFQSGLDYGLGVKCWEETAEGHARFLKDGADVAAILGRAEDRWRTQQPRYRRPGNEQSEPL